MKKHQAPSSNIQKSSKLQTAREHLCAPWTAVAERSGDTAFERAIVIEQTQCSVRAKAAWRFASRRSPKNPTDFAA